MCIQNQICALAEEKSELEYSDEHKTQFLQQEAHKKGQIQALEYLLTLSETAEEFTDINDINLDSGEC